MRSGQQIFNQIKGQLVTRGGIGTGRPQIDELVNAYCMNVY